MSSLKDLLAKQKGFSYTPGQTSAPGRAELYEAPIVGAFEHNVFDLLGQIEAALPDDKKALATKAAEAVIENRTVLSFDREANGRPIVASDRQDDISATHFAIWDGKPNETKSDGSKSRIICRIRANLQTGGRFGQGISTWLMNTIRPVFRKDMDLPDYPTRAREEEDEDNPAPARATKSPFRS